MENGGKWPIFSFVKCWWALVHWWPDTAAAVTLIARSNGVRADTARSNVSRLGKGPKIWNPYSNLQFLFNFLCALSFSQFVEKLYIGVGEGSISPFKSQCTIGVRWARTNALTSCPLPLCWGGKQLVWGSKCRKFFFDEFLRIASA